MALRQQARDRKPSRSARRARAANPAFKCDGSFRLAGLLQQEIAIVSRRHPLCPGFGEGGGRKQAFGQALRLFDPSAFLGSVLHDHVLTRNLFCPMRWPIRSTMKRPSDMRPHCLFILAKVGADLVEDQAQHCRCLPIEHGPLGMAQHPVPGQPRSDIYIVKDGFDVCLDAVFFGAPAQAQEARQNSSARARQPALSRSIQQPRQAPAPAGRARRAE